MPDVMDLMRKIALGLTVARYIAGMQRTLFESFDEFTDVMVDMTFKFACRDNGPASPWASRATDWRRSQWCPKLQR